MHIGAQALWPLVAYATAIVLFTGAILGVSHLLGPRHREPRTGEPFESGMPVTGSARLRLSPTFYLIAMFFVIFDLEAVFLFAWAVSARQTGWAGYIEAVIFIAVLGAALFYLARLGALDWRRGAGRKPAEPMKGGLDHARMAE